MAIIRLICDFLFGVLLIGGAPMSVFALIIILVDFFQKLSHVIIPDAVGFAIFAMMVVLGLLAFIFALRFRLRKRLSPRGLVVIEAALGIVGAIFLSGFFGVLMHSTID